MGARQLAAFMGGGAFLGCCVALMETCANHLSGGLLPVSELTVLSLFYACMGGLLGLAVGAAGLWLRLERVGSSALIVGITVLAFNALWVYTSHGSLRGLLFLLGAPVYLWVAVRLGALLVDAGRPLIALQRSILALVSMVFGTLAAELILDPSRLRDISTLASMLMLPLFAVGLHEVCTKRLLTRRQSHRLGPSAGVVLVIGLLIASPSLLFSQRGQFAPLNAARSSSGAEESSGSRGQDPRGTATFQRQRKTAPEGSGAPPSVLVISLDTTRADHLSVYGYGRDTTPHLAALADDSLVFNNCVSTSTWTLPSHASLFTGLHPRTHGATLAGSRLTNVDLESAPQVELDKVGMAHPLAQEHETLAELFAARGYATAAIVANHSYLYRYFGLAQGFQYYDDSPGLLLRRKPNAERLAAALSQDFLRRKYRKAEEITSEAIAWLDGIGPQPFFLFVNFMEPHAPLVIPRESRHHSAARTREAWRPWVREEVEYTRLVGSWSARERDLYAAMYDDGIRSMDAQIGRLLAHLGRAEGDDRLMVVVFGDHGELLGEHGSVGHIGRTPYEGLVRVPLLIKYPGSSRRGTWDGRVQTLDLFPTILDAAGIEASDAVQGQIVPDVSHEIVVEQFIHAGLAGSDPEQFDRETRAFYLGNYKLIATSRGQSALYDLEADPLEQSDLSAELPEVLEELLAALDEWDAETPFFARGTEEKPSEEVLERLRSLGYLD